MTTSKVKLQYRKWAIFQLWGICLLLLAAGFVALKTTQDQQLSITLIFTSLLLFATGSSLLNAIGKFMVRNMMRSIPIFIIHAIISYAMIKSMKPENGEALMNVYITILIFFLMITTVSVVFKAIYILMSNN